MLANITKRSTHEEAKDPTFDAIESVYQRRWTYLGHVLRMEEDQPVRKFLLGTSPDRSPYIPGSLLDDTDFDTIDEMVIVANDRKRWKKLYRKRTDPR